MTRKYTIIDRLEHDIKYERRVTVMFPKTIICLDPRAEVEIMTLAALSGRTGCVISMADGIRDASGQPVLIRNHHGGTRVQSWHYQIYPSIPVYWFLGYMMAQNRWGHVKKALQLLPCGERMHCYEQSTRSYMTVRLGQPADIIVPLSLVLNR